MLPSLARIIKTVTRWFRGKAVMIIPDKSAIKKNNLMPRFTPILIMSIPENIIAKQSEQELIKVLIKGFP